MTKEEKNTFVLRTTQANRTELIVVMQDILLTYLKDAKMVRENKEEFVNALELARQAIMELRNSLDLTNQIAKEIYPIYNFVDREIAKGIFAGKMDSLEEVIQIIFKLRESFYEVSKEDTSEPLMSNTQSVYAGMTYGKNQLNEEIWDEAGKKRGFLA